MPPIYQPEVAARGVVFAADHPGRKQYWVGGPARRRPSRPTSSPPGLLDRYLARTGYKSQQTSEAVPPGRPGNLWEPVDGDAGHDHGAHGSSTAGPRPRSPQLWASQHRGLLGGAAVAAAGATVTAVSALRRRGRR